EQTDIVNSSLSPHRNKLILSIRKEKRRYSHRNETDIVARRSSPLGNKLICQLVAISTQEQTDIVNSSPSPHRNKLILSTRRYLHTGTN
ncbi:hypothetical protein RRG08_049212, partial [Elysia crispata]